MPHHKNNRNTIQQTYILFGLLALINFLSLALHNEMLPFLYLIFGGIYYFLNCSISTSGNINYFAGINKLFLKKDNLKKFYLHWAMLVFIPPFFALYSLDFELLLIAIGINTLVTFLIWRNNPAEK